MINVLKIFNQTGFNKGEGIVASPWVPSMQTLVLCTTLCCHCTTSCTQRGMSYHRPGKGSVNKLPLVSPLLNMGSMFYHPILVPFTLEGYPVKVNWRIHDPWNQLLHPKLMEDPLGMTPLHYPKVYQWHLGPPNMLPGSAIHRQGAQHMRVRLPYNLHKWILSLVIMWRWMVVIFHGS